MIQTFFNPEIIVASWPIVLATMALAPVRRNSRRRILGLQLALSRHFRVQGRRGPHNHVIVISDDPITFLDGAHSMDWDARRLGRHLKLRDLHVLMTVARCGSMGKAAVQLAISQPAVSKAIADMEGTLRVRLLDRSPQGVEPTIYARALLDVVACRCASAGVDLRQVAQVDRGRLPAGHQLLGRRPGR